MTLPHILYIPFLLTVGFSLGYYVGTRNVRAEWDRAEARRKKREEDG